MDIGNETTATTTTTTTTATTIATTAFPFTYNPFRYTWTNVHKFDQCGPAFTELKKEYNRLDRELNDITRLISNYDRYYQTVEELYLNTSINVNAIEGHRRCSAEVDEAKEVLDTYETIAELAVNMTRSDSIAEAYSYAIQIPPLLKMTNALFPYGKVRGIDDNVTQKCEWLRQMNQKIRDENHGIEQEFENLEELTSNTERLFRTISMLFKTLNNEFSNKIIIFTRKGQEYLDQKITKSKLSQKFASIHFLKYRENVGDLTDDIQQLIKDYNEELTLAMEKLKEIYKKVLAFSVPVINSYNVYQLNLVTNATRMINDTILHNITNGLQINLKENMAALITETYKRLKQPFTEMKTNLLDPVDDMLEQINDLDELLTEYKMSTKMNTNFFM